MKLETIAVHAGGEVDSSTGAVAPPITLSTTFEHGPACEPIHAGYLYIRESNPTQTRLETALAELEGGDFALVFASGMAAGATLIQVLGSKPHVVFPDDIYVDFRNMAHYLLPQWEWSVPS